MVGPQDPWAASASSCTRSWRTAWARTLATVGFRPSQLQLPLPRQVTLRQTICTVIQSGLIKISEHSLLHMMNICCTHIKFAGESARLSGGTHAGMPSCCAYQPGLGSRTIAYACSCCVERVKCCIASSIRLPMAQQDKDIVCNTFAAMSSAESHAHLTVFGYCTYACTPFRL